MIDRKQWTAPQIEALLTSVAVFTYRNETIRWVTIAPATGHSARSCASKYHQVVDRADGPVTRELIDSEMARVDRTDRIPPPETVKMRGAYPLWTAAEDAKLLEACEGRTIQGAEAWKQLADESFEGRSHYAVRERYLVLRKLGAGIVRPRVRSERPKHLRVRMPPKLETIPDPMPPVEYKTLTAAFFRDPPPGRSALDKMRAGVVEQLPPSNHREVYYASRPKITLATEPLR